MIMRDRELATIMQQQDEDESQKQTDKEQRANINKGFQPATNNDAILATFLQHEQDNFSKMTDKNRSQQIRSKQIVDQLSQRLSDRLGAAVTRRGQGAESGGEGKDDHEGWRACHYYATAR